MNYKSLLSTMRWLFESYVRAIPDTVTTVDTEDFGWYNARYESDIFRLAHIELYSDEKIHVLHVTTFPHAWSPEPIFGFDVICTDTTVIGAYMDLSPGLIEYPFDTGMTFEERKPLPEWATVFSDRFILLKPTSDEEFEKFLVWTIGTYAWYLDQLKTKVTDDMHAIVAVQNNYCDVQASNPRTFSVLKAKIGETRAKYFMENILFPKIDIPN